jgi:hypothetical protein
VICLKLPLDNELEAERHLGGHGSFSKLLFMSDARQQASVTKRFGRHKSYQPLHLHSSALGNTFASFF